MKTVVLMYVGACILLAATVGCQPYSTTSTKNRTKKTTQTTSAVSENDGAIVSKTLVQLDGQTPDINIYDIFYMSHGVKVEEFVSIPKKNGSYPMVINLHGGYGAPRPEMTHVTDNVYSAASLMYAPDTQIIVEPEYQGYANSDGHVEDLESNTKDVQNAIASVMTMANVSPDDIYLIGFSMGGGIAIKIASERNDVRAVAAVSPFMGNDEDIKWLDAHPNFNTPLAEQERKTIPYWESIWGNYSTNPAGYQGVSIIDHISTIHAPILLLQGTGDQNVIWQTVQDVANDMKQQQKTVKLVLYPGGQHGLHEQYQDQALQEISEWFKNNGLPSAVDWLQK